MKTVQLTYQMTGRMFQCHRSINIYNTKLGLQLKFIVIYWKHKVILFENIQYRKSLFNYWFSGARHAGSITKSVIVQNIIGGFKFTTQQYRSNGNEIIRNFLTQSSTFA